MKTTTITKDEKIREAILSAIKSGDGSWQNITTHVNNTGVKIKNWLTEVRSVLQGLRNDKVIVRTNDLSNEVYVLINKAG